MPRRWKSEEAKQRNTNFACANAAVRRAKWKDDPELFKEEIARNRELTRLSVQRSRAKKKLEKAKQLQSMQANMDMTTPASNNSVLRTHSPSQRKKRLAASAMKSARKSARKKKAIDDEISVCDAKLAIEGEMIEDTKRVQEREERERQRVREREERERQWAREREERERESDRQRDREIREQRRLQLTDLDKKAIFIRKRNEAADEEANFLEQLSEEDDGGVDEDDEGTCKQLDFEAVGERGSTESSDRIRRRSVFGANQSSPLRPHTNRVTFSSYVGSVGGSDAENQPPQDSNHGVLESIASVPSPAANSDKVATIRRSQRKSTRKTTVKASAMTSPRVQFRKQIAIRKMKEMRKRSSNFQNQSEDGDPE